jgi:hypothetical protein
MAWRIKGQRRSTPRLDFKAEDFAIPLGKSFGIPALDEDTAHAGDMTWLLSHGRPLTGERERKGQNCKVLERHPSSYSSPALMYPAALPKAYLLDAPAP